MIVLHASAAFAWLQEEPGSRLINLKDSCMTALDLAAILDEARQNDLVLESVFDSLTALIKIVPVYPLDVLAAAQLNPDQPLADRIALAVAQRLGVDLVTSDSLWADRVPTSGTVSAE